MAVENVLEPEAILDFLRSLHDLWCTYFFEYTTKQHFVVRINKLYLIKKKHRMRQPVRN